MRIFLVSVLMILSAAAASTLSACQTKHAQESSAPAQEKTMAPTRSIAEVLADHDQEILAIPGVTMIYVGADPQGNPCLKVGVETATPEVEERIPHQIEGWPVVVEETGKIEPMH